jgi:hypothetical protein
MGIVVQLMMAVSLAACAGLRAWLPMLATGILGRTGYITLSPSFLFLQRKETLIILGIATVLEILGDKIIVIDHFLDAVGTVVRPAAGAVVASAAFTHIDPTTAMVLGLLVGAPTSLTVHAAKSMVRTKFTLAGFLHGGLGNAAVSTAEDGATIGLIFLIMHALIIAFVFAVLAIIGSIWIIHHMWKAGSRLFRFAGKD